MDYENENTSPEAANNDVRLEELSNSDYEIRDGEPDIIGWDVKNNGGGKLGEVDELIFDPQARKVRYIVLNMEGNELDLEDERRVLLPIGLANLHTDKDEVVVPVITELQLQELPPYEGCPELTPGLEIRIRNVFDSTGSTAPYEHPQFYAHEHFNEDRFYNRGSQPDNQTIIPAETMDRTVKADRIMERIHQTAEEPKTSEFPEGKVVGEYQTTESLERENSQPVEETGNNDYRLNEGLVPEPESPEQEEAWEDEQDEAADNNKLMEFFINELKDLLWAERELVETLPDMVEAATSAELRSAFEMHLTETQTHVTRLEEVFGILGLEPESRKCDAMAGILDEGDEIIGATEDGTAQRDVGLIFAGQKAEHYEIASYGGMIALAKTLGYYEIAELFVLTLDEEKTADAKLTEIAESQANYDASTERADD